jgi:hypothetical protein
MTIERDVLAVARRFGLDPALLQAVANAEGDIVRAVQCSLPSVTTREDALCVTARSAVHAMCDWIKAAGQDRAERKQSFLAFWAGRWAPPGAENDPNNLNANWPMNVGRLWSDV